MPSETSFLAGNGVNRAVMPSEPPCKVMHYQRCEARSQQPNTAIMRDYQRHDSEDEQQHTRTCM